MRLIGLTGPACSGKDTVANFLVETQGFVQIALADPIRDGLKAMFGLTDEDFTDRARKETAIHWLGKSPRHLMQSLGTAWGRECIDPELWITMATRRLNRLRNMPPCMHIAGVVISDIRLENEASWVRSSDGEIWHVYRRFRKAQLEAIAQAHITEQGIRVQPRDRIIRNYSSIDSLQETIATLI